MRTMKGMRHLHLAWPSGRGAEKLAPWDTSHARGLQLKKIPRPFIKELPTCNKTHRDVL